MILLSLSAWLKAGKRKPRHRFAPRLEILEARTVLSGGYGFSTLDDPNAGTTGNGIQGTFVIGINAGGLISGNYGDANNVTHGFLLAHGTYSTFDDPNAGTGAGQGTNAFGLNARGQIVGEYVDSNNVQHGFLLSNGRFTTIDDPNAGTGPFLFDQAVGINARGQIVGSYTDAQGSAHGYLLSGGQYTTLDDPNGVTTFALGINASGQILGGYTDASGVSHGFLLAHGQYTTFDDPNGVQTFAGGINDSGQIVGYYLDAANVFHGFVRSAGQYTTLDDPNAGTGAFQGTFAFGINGAGNIVGTYFDGNNLAHGYLATPVHGDSASGAAGNPGSGSGQSSVSDTLKLHQIAFDLTGLDLSKIVVSPPTGVKNYVPPANTRATPATGIPLVTEQQAGAFEKTKPLGRAQSSRTGAVNDFFAGSVERLWEALA